jgi:Transposase DDE domain
MTTYPSSLSVTPALTDETTLEATVACLSEHLQVDMEGAYSAEDLFQILVYAASRSDTIEHTAQSLHGVPSGNGIRYHLNQWADMATLEAQVNAALSSRIPPRIAKHQQRKQSIAIDLNLLPYYGQVTPESAPYLYRSQAKAGTTAFFAYATADVICRNKRVTLAIHAVHRQETLVATVSYLLAQLYHLRVRVRCLYLDRGFYSVPIIRWLKALYLPFIMPAIVRGKTGGTRQLLQGRKSYTTSYTLASAQYGSVQCRMCIVCGYYMGFKQQHGIDYQLYVVHRINVPLHRLHAHYRKRFGIESSYRIKNLCRIRTTTHNPITRLLFVALSFILVNLWVYLRWYCISRSQRGGQVVYTKLFPLRTMLDFLGEAVKQRFPLKKAVYLPALK